MARLLYDTETATLHPYPRQDDEPIVGLDPRYLVMQLIQEPQPAYDPQAERLEPTEVIDLAGATVTRGWAVIPLEPPAPPEPAPDWGRFRDEVLNSQELLQLLGDSTQHPDSEVRARASMLIPLYLLAEHNGVGPFRDTWRHLVAALPVLATVIERAIAAATAYHLPPEFIEALEPPAAEQ